MLTGTYCFTRKEKERDFERKYKVRNKLPYNHRYIAKREYYKKTFENAWKWHLRSHNLQVEDIRLRKMLYDAIEDSLQNRHGKIHKKDWLTEIEKFNRYFDENFRNKINISDWENYRKSKQYEELKAYVGEIEDFSVRTRIMTDNVMIYLYSKYQKGFQLGEKITDLEKTFKLDLIEKAWSKKSLWFLATLLFFDANNLYASTLANNEISIKEYDPANDAIKIHITPFYERKWIDVAKFDKLMFKIYDNIIVPIVGEVGSVLLAEAAKQGTVIALQHASRLLTQIATFHPLFRTLKWGATLIDALAHILDNSVLAWLGWQIGVEWSLDSYIQMAMHKGLAWFYGKMTGINPKLFGKEGIQEFINAIKLTQKKFSGEKLTKEEEERLNAFKNIATQKQLEILQRIEESLKINQALKHMKNYYDFFVAPYTKRYDNLVSNYLRTNTVTAIKKAAVGITDMLEKFADMYLWYAQETGFWNENKAISIWGKMLSLSERYKELFKKEKLNKTYRFLINSWGYVGRWGVNLAFAMYLPCKFFEESRRIARIFTGYPYGEKEIDLEEENAEVLQVSIYVRYINGAINFFSLSGRSIREIDNYLTAIFGFPILQALAIPHIEKVAQFYNSLKVNDRGIASSVISQPSIFLRARKMKKCISIIQNVKRKRMTIQLHQNLKNIAFLEINLGKYIVTGHIGRLMFWWSDYLRQYNFTHCNIANRTKKVRFHFTHKQDKTTANVEVKITDYLMLLRGKGHVESTFWEHTPEFYGIEVVDSYKETDTMSFTIGDTKRKRKRKRSKIICFPFIVSKPFGFRTEILAQKIEVKKELKEE